MNRKRMSVVVTLSIAIATTFSILAAPLVSAATKPKAAGRTSTTIPNTILNGKGAPLSKNGINGDFYIDTRSLLIYGPKKSGKWPLPQNLQGPVGANGTDGKNGNEGKTISTASTVAGPTGAQGTQGEKGEKGEKGEAGAPGASGSTGPAGATGATGPQGPAGGGGGGSAGPAGATGATGATGLTGLTGAKGETGTAGVDGLVGLKGETGTVGATGPSNVYVNALPNWTLSTGSARTSSTSALLPKFKAGKSYIYTIHLTGLSNSSTGIFEIDIIHEDSSASRFNYTPTKQDNFQLEPIFFRYSFVISGVITTTSADVGISIKVTDDKGSTGSNALSLSGYMYSTLVGSIGAL
jgi:Collagen triple helix repeat (20 copies)